jgi:hypothetical protein
MNAIADRQRSAITDDEGESIRTLADSGVTMADTARMMGRAYQTIANYAGRHGITFERPRRLENAVRIGIGEAVEPVDNPLDPKICRWGRGDLPDRLIAEIYDGRRYDLDGRRISDLRHPS